MVLQFMHAFTLQEEFIELQEKKFLLPNDKLSGIKFNLHENDIWAKAFWRRRLLHAQREDPELPFIFPQKPSSVLEIGAGYGRILRKLIENNEVDSNSTLFHGIEICPYLEPYFHRYRKSYSSLKKCDIIFENFMTTSVLQESSYDIILFPMNTLPSIPFDELDALFAAVRTYLTEDGMFLFSTYKHPNQVEKFLNSLDKWKGHSGELLLDLGLGAIVAEYYDFPYIETEYGARIITYMCYNSFTRDYILEKREIYRNSLEFVLENILHDLISKSGLSIKIRDDSSHSLVYGLTKMR